MGSYGIQTYIIVIGVIAASAVFIVISIKLRTRFLRKVLNVQDKEECEQDSDDFQERNSNS